MKKKRAPQWTCGIGGRPQFPMARKWAHPLFEDQAMNQPTIYLYIHDNPSRRTWQAAIDLPGFLEAATAVHESDNTDKLKVSTLLALRLEDLLETKPRSPEERLLLEGDIEQDAPGLFHLAAMHAGVTDKAFDEAKLSRPESHYLLVRYQTAKDIHLRTAMLAPEAAAMPGLMTRETLLGFMASMEDDDREYLKSLGEAV